jgi:hypothetical protein
MYVTIFILKTIYSFYLYVTIMRPRQNSLGQVVMCFGTKVIYRVKSNSIDCSLPLEMILMQDVTKDNELSSCRMYFVERAWIPKIS